MKDLGKINENYNGSDRTIDSFVEWIKMKSNDIPDFNAWLVQNDIAVSGIRSMHSLEQYFIQVTSKSKYVEAYTS